MRVACGVVSLDNHRNASEGNSTVKLSASFYVGISDYSAEGFAPPAEDQEQLDQAETMSKAFEEGDLRVDLEGLDIEWPEPDLELETAVADDQPGLPILLYVTATFEVPSDDEEAVEEAEDELDELLTAVLVGGGSTVPFQGVYELEYE